MDNGGALIASLFEVPVGRPISDQLTHCPGGIVTQPDEDPYHYRFASLAHAAEQTGRLYRRRGDIHDHNDLRASSDSCAVSNLLRCG